MQTLRPFEGPLLSQGYCRQLCCKTSLCPHLRHALVVLCTCAWGLITVRRCQHIL